MRLAIGSYAYRWAIGIGDAVGPTRMTPAGLVEHAARQGVRCVQIADNLPLHLQPDRELKALERALAVHGVDLELGFGGISPVLLGTYLDLADRFGVKLLRVAPDAADAASGQGELTARLRTMGTELLRRNRVLAIENHFHLPSPRLRDIVVAVASPAVGVCLDVANSIAVGEWPAQTIELLAPHAVNLHLKDYRVTLDPHGVGITFGGAPLGQGLIDPVAVLRRLRPVRQDMTVVLEQWAPRGRNFEESCDIEERWLIESLETARAAMARAEGEQE
jgi:sugar phosphate isomerase/epimerase